MADNTQKSTNKLHPMHVQYYYNIHKWVMKEKGSCSEPTSHEANQINIACFTTWRGIKECCTLFGIHALLVTHTVHIHWEVHAHVHIEVHVHIHVHAYVHTQFIYFGYLVRTHIHYMIKEERMRNIFTVCWSNYIILYM